MTDDLFRLDGKVAVVTGGGRGIGFMAAEGLVRAGATVVIASRDGDACENAAEQLSKVGTAVGLRADLSAADDRRRLADEVSARWSRLDILLNNAGTAWGAPFDEFPERGWDKVMDINLKAPFFIAQTFADLLTASASDSSPSRIINIGSIDGIRPPRLQNYSYAASKAGLHQLTRMLAVDLAPRRITVNAIAPGFFESKMTAATLDQKGEEFLEACPLGKFGSADDIAGIVVYLASRASTYVTGTVIPVDGGLSLV